MFKYITSILLLFLVQQCADTSINKDSMLLVVTPKPWVELPEKLEESSGLEVVHDKIYSVNDSGGKARLFVFDKEGGASLGKIKISHVENHDWESLAANDTHFFIGDFGNNSGKREDLAIHYFPIEALEQDTIEAASIHFKYANQPHYNNKKKKHSFDGESLIALEDRLVIFSKDWLSHATQVYQLPLNAIEDTVQISPSEKMPINALVTGADYLAKNKRLVLCGYKNGHVYLWVFHNSTPQKFLTQDYTKIRLEGLYGAQVEGVTFLNENQILISTEKNNKFKQQMWIVGLD